MIFLGGFNLDLTKVLRYIYMYRYYSNRIFCILFFNLSVNDSFSLLMLICIMLHTCTNIYSKHVCVAVCVEGKCFKCVNVKLHFLMCVLACWTHMKSKRWIFWASVDISSCLSKVHRYFLPTERSFRTFSTLENGRTLSNINIKQSF